MGSGGDELTESILSDHRRGPCPGYRHRLAFYVEQHNAVMPHAAFQGQTPDETYFGTGAEIPAKLAAAHRAAIAARASVNRALHFGSCQPAPPVPAVPVAVNPPVLSNVLQMHAPNDSRMP